MTSAQPALRREFDAEEGTFLLLVRGMVWDRSAFSRMELLMRQVCTEVQGHEMLERWLVEGFWFLSDWLPEWTSHTDFPRPEPRSYYEAAIRRMRDLQWWLVMGASPYMPEHRWVDL